MLAFERSLIEDALKRSRWNVSATAREIGMSRSTLHKRMLALGLVREVG